MRVYGFSFEYEGATAKEHYEWVQRELEEPVSSPLRDPATKYIATVLKEMAKRLMEIDELEENASVQKFLAYFHDMESE